MPSRQELLVNHYLKAAGVATVSVDADGVVIAHDAVGIKTPAGATVFCCELGDEERFAKLLEGYSGDQAAVAARIEQARL